MATTHIDRTTVVKPLRLWPGVAAALAIVLFNVLSRTLPGVFVFGLPLAIIGAMVAAAGGAVIVVWWLFFSRARWSERLGALAAIAIGIAVVRPFLHESIAGAGMGFLFFFYAPATAVVALVAWAVATRSRSDRVRLVSLAATILIAVAVWALVRTGGIRGEGGSDLHWRWTPTPEQKLLAAAAEKPEAVPAVPEAKAGAAAAAKPATEPAAPADPVFTRAEWPGFRGPQRDGVARGVRVETDWAQHPPQQLWRRPVGPGWSSFAVAGNFIYTQEQRGDEELVSCYSLATGQPVWRHRDPVRFYESNGGAGPRGTPTLHDGRVYTLGATGILNALDARTGAVVWSRNAAKDADREVPQWGFASSPLVIDGRVIVALSGRLAAFAVADGTPLWLGEPGGGGYSSPHLATIAGVPQVLLIRGSRTIGIDPADGKRLWDHTWERGTAITQPALTEDGDILLSAGDATGMGGMGMRRISVSRGANGWKAEERWTSRGLKPYFNDSVVHKGHAFGFDGSILSCIELSTGERKWKGGRYGHGQMVLLPDDDLLLVVSEDGDVALVKATPDQFTEVARFKAIEGKTWNHPVVVGDTLLVRNGEEMAAFRLPRARQ